MTFLTILKMKCGKSANVALSRWAGKSLTSRSNFVTRIDDIWVKSVYNDKQIVFLFQWDDRSKSVATEKPKFQPTEVNLEVIWSEGAGPEDR